MGNKNQQDQQFFAEETDELWNEVVKDGTDAIKEKERIKQERLLEQNRRDFSARIEKLAERTVDMIEKNGEEHYLTQLLITFYDVAVQMEDIINTLQDVTTALSCITDAMKCMDGIMSLNSIALDSSLEENHGFWARRREKKRVKSVVKNNMGRIKSITDTLAGAQTIAFTTIDGLQEASENMQRVMAKRQIKQNKRTQKRAEQRAKNPIPTVSAAPTASRRHIEELLAARRAARAEDSVSSDASTASTGSSSPAGGVDDTSGLF